MYVSELAAGVDDTNTIPPQVVSPTKVTVPADVHRAAAKSRDCGAWRPTVDITVGECVARLRFMNSWQGGILLISETLGAGSWELGTIFSGCLGVGVFDVEEHSEDPDERVLASGVIPETAPWQHWQHGRHGTAARGRGRAGRGPAGEASGQWSVVSGAVVRVVDGGAALILGLQAH